ncbi:MAG TPA: GAF domain-containing protein [Anaerolineae bacterium]|nr:GAF domain-containing protein [Anaerolineae bacterium]
MSRGLDLAQILQDHRGEIATAWAEMVHRLPDSHYNERPLEELRASTMRGLGAIIEALRGGSYTALEAYLTDVSLTRLEMGFDISEVIEALLLCKDAILPFIWQAFPPDSADAREAIAQLDGCLRRMIGRFGHLYAEGMGRRLARQADRLRAVNEVGRQIASFLSLDELLPYVVTLLRETFHYYNVNISLLDPEAGEMVLRASAGEFAGEPPLGVRVKVGEEGIVGWVAAKGEPLLVNDVSRDPRYYPLEALKGTRSELAVPIVAGGKVVGVLDVESTEVGAFGEEDFFTLRTLADQIAVAIENARLCGGCILHRP